MTMLNAGAALTAPLDPLFTALVEGKQRVREREVVLRLFDALHDSDRHRVASFFNEETLFEPLDGTPVQGPAAIWLALQESGVERRLLQAISVDAGQVSADICERRRDGEGWRESRLSCIFAVRGCKILRWSEQPAP